MDEERQVRPGFLPPRAPGGAGPAPHEPAAADPPRPAFVAQRMESGPRSGLALSGTVVGAISLLLLVMTVGIGYVFTGLLGLVSIMLGLLARQQIQQAGVGRAGQARAAIWVGGIALGLSIVAAIVWAALDASGFAPEDLQRWMEQQTDELRSRSRG